MFRVRWEKKAVDELTKLWIEKSILRKAITAATHQIDQHLVVDPFAQTESRPQGRRILFCFPLGVLFRVEADEQTVSVLKTWLFNKREKN